MGRHLLPVLIGLALIGCNLLSGSADLAVCEGAACGDAGVSASSSSGSPGAEAGAGDGALPPTCVDGQKACEGRQLATCAGTTWSKTACAEACADGACVPWPSCRAAPGTTLPVCGEEKVSCCEAKAVPGGTFNRRNQSQYPATISAFQLDTFEVTVGRFRRFVAAGEGTTMKPPAAGAGAHPKIPSSGWQTTWTARLPPSSAELRSLLEGGTWTNTPSDREQQPINEVPWLVAFAFCAWDGGRLPTFAERNFAAAGGTEQRYYPWSTTSEPQISSANAAYACNYNAPAYTCPASYCNVGNATPCDAAACTALAGTCVTPSCFGCEPAKDIANVGSFAMGKGRYGHHDLSGNVGELVLDAFPRKDDGPTLPTPCIDCALLMGATPNGSGPGGSEGHDVFIAGGAWTESTFGMRAGSYDTAPWYERSDRTGFRCARD